MLRPCIKSAPLHRGRLPQRRICKTLLICTGVLIIVLQHCNATVFDALAAAKDVTVQNNLKDAQQKLTDNPGYTLPVPWVHAGVVYKGVNWRLRRLLLQAAAGVPIHIGLVGGSISCGLGLSGKFEGTYQAVFSRRLQSLFPATNVTFMNGCSAATQSALAAACAEYSVRAEAQLVFVEFALNDGWRESVNNPGAKAMERLVRKLLHYRMKPAVFLFNVLTHGQAFWRHADPGMEKAKLRFWQNPDEVYGMIAQYYGANWLSLRDTVWHAFGTRNDSSHHYSDIFSEDHIHPNTQGHQLMSDIAMALVQQTLSEMTTFRPYSKEDEDEFNRELDVPIFEGNYAPMTVTCAFGTNLPPVVTSSDGWQFVNEGVVAHKPKWGFVTNKTNTPLTVKVHTSGEGGKDGSERVVHIAYLKSYEHMGTARMRCVSGCTCSEVLVDAHDAVRKESQTHVANMKTTAALDCVIEITVVEATSSGEHKFKVNGVLVTWDASTTGFSVAGGLGRFDHV